MDAPYANVTSNAPSERDAAHRAVNSAIRRGQLVRPDLCEGCGTKCGKRIDAHHDDYSQPLTIRWLGSTCHRRHHAKGNVRAGKGHEQRVRDLERAGALRATAVAA